MKKIEVETFPMTWAEIKKLKGIERHKKIKEYKTWLKEQREKDRRKQHNEETRMYRKEIRNFKKALDLNKYRCMICGKKVSKYGLRCKKCFGLSIRKKGQTNPTAIFIIFLIVLLLTYILALPPTIRDLLLS